MAATFWSKSAPTATAYSNSRAIPNLGVTMNATAYTMNSTVATMNDEKPNPIFGGSTAYTKQAKSATAWTKT